MLDENARKDQPTPAPPIAFEHAEPVYQLVYCSTSLIGEFDGGGHDEIEAILAVATDRNAQYGVTGALTFNETHFAQVLEGGREAVLAVFDRIARDPRHTDVTVLQQGDVTARDFAQWAMAYVGDETSVQFLSANVRLDDILARNRERAALGLIEMMKFCLWRQS